MAQLVKLQDYISRYEQDLTRYPNQFLRLKKYHWQRMQIQWKSGAFSANQAIDVDESPKKSMPLSSIFRFFKKEDKAMDPIAEEQSDADLLDFNPNIVYEPNSIDQLKRLFLDQLFHFQMKWASSTLSDKSYVASKYYRDALLRSLLLELPDNYFVFYEPILKVQQAPIQLDVIIITPVECMCLTFIDAEEMAVFSYDNSRFWIKRVGEKETKVLNPLLSLDRMTKIVGQIVKDKEIEFPVKKYLISRDGYIDDPTMSFDVTVVDRRSYEEWFASIKKMVAPLKYVQFRAAQAILDVSQTTARSRLLEDVQVKADDNW